MLIDTSSLHIFSYLLLYLLQKIERTSFFNYIFKFFIFTAKKTIYFFILKIYWNYCSIILSSFSKLLDESNKLLSFNIKSINPIQKYQDIIESKGCNLKMFVIFVLRSNLLIYFGICSTPKLQDM